MLALKKHPLSLTLEQEFSIDYIPKRIISLVPSQTELLYDLGLETKIIGITKFCIHPHKARGNKDIVGGTKNINIEKIKALQPDIILCNKEENTKEVVASCQKICPVHVSDIYTLADAKKMIENYGIFFHKSIEARSINQEIDDQLNDFQSYIKQKPTLKVAYFIWKNPWMVAAKNTFIHHLLELNKYENVYQHLERYPEIVIENLGGNENPELIFLSSEPYPFKEKHIAEITKHTSAKVFLVDGELFSWYGSRLLKSFDYFKKLREQLK